ncbi:MAG TPA: hypothetical protein VGB73_10340 [Pyrinomonadaceae bacterium]|jgi:hypothetical protein
MSCKLYRIEIEEASRGAEPGVEARAHLRECAACRKFYEERQSLRNLLAGLGTVSAPADFEFRLRARMAAENGRGSSRPVFWRRFAPGALSIALAACFALTVAVALRFRLFQPPANAPAQSAASIAQVNLPPAPAPDASLRALSTEDDSARTKETFAATGDAVVKRNSMRASTRRVRFVRAPKDGTKMEQPTQTNGELNTGFTAATVLRAGSTESSNDVLKIERTAFAVPVNTSAEPMRLVLRDEQGMARVVAVKSVSFGGQQLVGRLGHTATTADVPLREGVW